MTKSTDNKNIKKIVQGILYKYSIDNLQMEIDLCSAWQRYVNEREEGLTPAEVREKIAGEYNFGMSKEVLEYSRMKRDVENTLRLNVDDTPDWEALIKFLLKMEQQGQTIIQYQEWRVRDVYNSPKAHQIAQNPLIVNKTWPQAFVLEQKAEKAKVYSTVEDDMEFVPAPEVRR